MKPSCSSFVLLAAMMMAIPATSAVEVSSCAELADVDDTSVTRLTITEREFNCEEYTRFVVRDSMVLESTESEVVFTNFALKVQGELEVVPAVTFTGVVDEASHGGALHVEAGAVATFRSTASFMGNSIIPLMPEPEVFVYKKGAAIYNQGDLTFEGDAQFVGNRVRNGDEFAFDPTPVQSGAIFNGKSGAITFEEGLLMEDNTAEGDDSQGRLASEVGGGGGAILNRGTIDVRGVSDFLDNRAPNGGAIRNDADGTFIFHSFTNIVANRCVELVGGAIFNDGGVMEMRDGSLFERNRSGSSSESDRGGAIFNSDGGLITLEGSTRFIDNSAVLGGGAIYSDETRSNSRTIFPDDTVFADNRVESFCPDFHDGDNDNCPEDVFVSPIQYSD